MSLPRQILPGSTYLVTRRCTQRQFLLKPTPLTNMIFAFCLAMAAIRTGVLLHAFCVLSNHWHGVVTDPQGRLPEFLAYLHKYVSKCINASLGRWENLWSSEPPSIVRLESDEDVLDKIAYVMTNPLAAGLVKRSSKWPGLREYQPGTHIVRRPRVFFRSNGPMPEVASLTLVPPPLKGSTSTSETIRRVKQAVADREAELRKQLAIEGKKPLGLKAIRAQKVTDTPWTKEPRRRLSPRVAAKDKWRRVEALRRVKAFVDAYREAYERWKAGILEVVFPPGTYALRIHAGVRCACP
jgi:REP element-mobilizing transposase RayT